MSALRVGIFGGTFNPIHLGHLLLAETAREALSLDRVLFIPVGQPPHKRVPGLLNGAARLRMVQLAIKDHPGFAASDLELQRTGPSYSIDTVTALTGALPEAKLFLLIGQDMLGVRWVAWNELTRLCRVVVARRSLDSPHALLRNAKQWGSLGIPPRGHPRGAPQASRVRPQPEIRWLDMPLISIASLDIRARIAVGRSIRYLVPAPVERYIRRHRLYQAVGERVG